MFLKLFVAFGIAFNSGLALANNKPVIEVYNDSNISTPSGRMMNELIKLLNVFDPTNEYRSSSVFGANGEAAIARAVQHSKTGQKVLILSPLAPFTYNKIPEIEQAIKYNKDTDFIFLSSFASSYSGVMVSPLKGYESIDDLINKIKSGSTQIHFGRTASSGTNKTLGDMFIDHYKIRDKINIVVYSKLNDMMMALNNGEADFTIHSPAEFTNPKVLMVAGNKRAHFLPNVPTSTELGYSDFNLTPIWMIYTTKDNEKFAEQMRTVITKFCKSEDLTKLVTSYNRNPICMNESELKTYMNEEMVKINKHR
jgi:tripartite-type tricarboxylate transporter receptor subunit TctC